MDEILVKKIEQKIIETVSNRDELKKLAVILSDLDNSKSFIFGIVVGRLYNAFYYQSKRILKREPTSSEFQEFLEFIKCRRADLEDLW